ncbi:DsbA family oxidoreductase [Celeribacter sp. PS-C1]|uniref:DsbA family oxidoreductase n=1 Tax=Celeribacter sp. PS-C1 TaxID=2820813 RepID=UPI001C670F32|nr:DsbA family oxidoreductase [Celeribacter sp. PS-C1]MBW6417157.1 DsbA family oxidoreductase [Celeribacter sp. PS-C1]
MITLDIFHDPICPWCYIGKTRLDRALEARPDHPFSIQWHPFQLNPTMPKEGMDRLNYLEMKFHGTEGAMKAYRPIIDVLHKEIPQADLGKIKRTPNTLDAHRLVHWAGIDGRQTAAVSALFRAYFKEGRDIGSRAVLAEIAGEIEMDPDAIARLLETDADIEEIVARDAHARERGIKAVPMFIIDNLHAVEGAQPTELWLEVIDELTVRNTL